jgi:Bacterial regulatory proteins, luxR family
VAVIDDHPLFREGLVTVKHHMTNIMQKLKVRNRVEAALKVSARTGIEARGSIYRRRRELQHVGLRSGLLPM